MTPEHAAAVETYRIAPNRYRTPALKRLQSTVAELLRDETKDDATEEREQ